MTFPIGTPMLVAFRPEPGTPAFDSAEALRREGERMAASIAAFHGTIPPPPVQPAPASAEAIPHEMPIPRSAFPNALAIVAGTLAAIIAPD